MRLSKKRALKLFNTFEPVFIKYLNLSKYNIKYHIISVKNKKFKVNKWHMKNVWGFCNTSLSGATKISEVVLYYDICTESRFVSTLFHELLHVRLASLTHLITLNSDKGHKIEEKIVRDLEALFIGLLYK